jgi:ATP-dependent 26S proteasome regulatory subunit
VLFRSNKIKSNLFFNVFTTKILPVVVKVAGIPLGIVASGFSFPIFEINPQPVPGDYQGAAKFMAKGAIKYVAPFFLTVGGLWTLGNFLTDLQIQEYEYRIKKKQEDADKLEVSKELEGKKILVENEVTLSQVFGHEVIKREKLGVMIDFLKHPIKYKSQRTKNVLTALFYGPPGTGKTLMARAVSGESKAPFVQVSADDFLSNNSKDKLLGIWELANSAARSAKSRSAIIYIDEVDFSVGNRAKGKLDSGKSRALSNLLAILDGIVKPNPYIHILIIMTTNHLDDLDSALLRPGRIDQKVFVGYPNTKTRHKLLSHLIPKESHININDIVEKSSGFSPAHIVSIVESANRQAILTGQKYPLLQQYLYELSQFQGDKNEDLLEIGDE